MQNLCRKESKVVKSYRTYFKIDNCTQYNAYTVLCHLFRLFMTNECICISLLLSIKQLGPPNMRLKRLSGLLMFNIEITATNNLQIIYYKLVVFYMDKSMTPKQTGTFNKMSFYFILFYLYTTLIQSSVTEIPNDP